MDRVGAVVLQLERRRATRNTLEDNFREIVTEVLSATDLVDVIGAQLELKSSGGPRFKALCPFHNEKTPSFIVNRDRQTYYCFGCQKHGDALSFIQEHDGLTFMEALQRLADRNGIRLPEASRFGGGDGRMRERLMALGQSANVFFRDALNDSLRGGGARGHLAERALKAETVKRFSVGFAPDDWHALRDHLRREGFDDKTLEASGLVKRSDKDSLYDFFRNRLTFPIRDASGNVVAFGGRDLGEGPAKYINSPENALYKKSRVLYGIHEAREALRSSKQAILVEGYFDVLRCFDNGIENVVATCGTALTAEQAALIRRYVPEVLVVFDGDAAGVSAALRGVGTLAAAGLTVRAMLLPEATDPDDYIKKEGADAFRAMAGEAMDFVRFYVHMNGPRTETIEGRTEIARELFGMFHAMDDAMRREEYLKHLAKELQLDPYRSQAEYAKFAQERAGRLKPVDPEAKPPAPFNDYDRDFVALLLNDGDLLQFAMKNLQGVDFSEGPLREVVAALFEDVRTGAWSRLENDGARNLYSAAAAADKVDDGAKAEQQVQRHIQGLVRVDLRRKATSIQEEIENAQRLKDDSSIVRLLREKVDIEQEIERVGAA